MALVLDVRRRGPVCVVEFEGAADLRCTRAFAQQTRIGRGQRIEPALIERLRETAGMELGLDLARRRLARGIHSRAALSQRLLGAGVPRRAAEAALDQLEALGELDDAAGALALARIALREHSEDWDMYRTRCGGRLRRRGFGAAEISRALTRAWAEADAPAAD